MITLTKEQILAMHAQLIAQTGGAYGVRDMALLDAAIQAPFQSFGTRDFYPTVQAKAARLGYGLIQNHPMIDGNKRIGAHAMLVLLALNGIPLDYTQQELYSVILGVASGEIGNAELLAWILAHQA